MQSNNQTGRRLEQRVIDCLRQAKIPETLQRLEIGQILLSKPVHMTAEQVLEKVREHMPDISRATVYNTLKLFRERHLIREVNVAAGRVYYDSNMAPHFHLYDVLTGVLSDVAAGDAQLVGMPLLPPGVELEQVDVVFRVRNAPVSMH